MDKKATLKIALSAVAAAAFFFCIGVLAERARFAASSASRAADASAVEAAALRPPMQGPSVTNCPVHGSHMLRGGVFSEDDLKVADAIGRSAARGDAGFLSVAKSWAGEDVTRRFWICDMARNAGRTNELAALARDAADACVGDAATFARLFRAAKFLEECQDWTALRTVLARAAPLATRRTQREDVAFAELRLDLATEGPTEARLGELRRISTSATMNDNRRAAARILEKYAR